MRLVSFTKNGHGGSGILHGDGVFPLQNVGFEDALSFIAAGRQGREEVESLLTHTPAHDLLPLDSVRLTAPIPRPPKILCVGLNYRDHAKESNMEVPSVPTIFAKYSNAVIGPGDPIVVSTATEKPD